MNNQPTPSESITTEVYNRLREGVASLIEIYGRAWMHQDSELILTVFTSDATYYERILAEPMRGHEAIKDYWETKVLRDQANIEFRLLDLFVDPFKFTAIAVWEACFDDIPKNCRKRMQEFAILELKGGKISSLRECWSSELITRDS